MAPSARKSLRASLRQQGLIGPSASKKDRQRGGKGDAKRQQKRAETLAAVREQFNPFELKQSARGAKHAFANDTSKGVVLGRPGVTKGRGEEIRRNTLLQDMRRRQKVGGLLDRRIGENDPTMAPEDRAMQRFMREKQSQSRKASMFDLEDDPIDADTLTHRGQALRLEADRERDDFDAGGLEDSDDDVDEASRLRAEKRRRLHEANGDAASQDEDQDALNGLPKSRKEVMQEVIAKSKQHRYERLKAKEDDEDLREELDSGLGDMLSLLRGSANAKDKAPAKESRIEPAMNPDRAALLAGKDRDQLDREFDVRLRQLAQEARAQPSTRTKTDDEIAQEEAQRLKDLEEKRLRRMRGESVSSNEAGETGDYDPADDFEDDNILGQGIGTETSKQLDVEDEDEFVVEDDLVAEGSDLEFESPSASEGEADASDEDDDEFTAGILSEQDAGRIADATTSAQPVVKDTAAIPFTFPCPQTHAELVAVTKDTAHEDLHTVIQRIRALHHPRLADANKEKLAWFSKVLVQHLPYLAQMKPPPPFATLEAVIRHVHSLAKTYPTEVALAYRDHLLAIHTKRALDLHAGDLVILVGISTTFSTSDLFHPVATPAMMTLARYIGQRIPRTFAQLATGLFACTLCLRYQAFSKRYVPEVVNYLVNTLCMLAPTPYKDESCPIPIHTGVEKLRISKSDANLPEHAGRLQFFDIQHTAGDEEDDARIKQGLLAASINLISRSSTLWRELDSYPEIFEPFIAILKHLAQPANAKLIARSAIKTQIPQLQRTLKTQIRAARSQRVPLALHNHRPMPIKQSVPKFEVDFHPDKHYDADEQRAARARLRKEHRRERKGALRELRKDAAFVAREELRDKIERESAQKEKERRVIAQIQTQEGGEANRYAREKKLRLGKR